MQTHISIIVIINGTLFVSANDRQYHIGNGNDSQNINDGLNWVGVNANNGIDKKKKYDTNIRSTEKILLSYVGFPNM